MIVTVNGEERTLPEGATVATLVAELGLPGRVWPWPWTAP